MSELKPKTINLYQPGDLVRPHDSSRIGVIVSFFYLPYRQGCKHGIPDTYYFPELVVYDDGAKPIDEENYLHLYYGWIYFITYLNGRDDELDIVGENCLVLVNDYDQDISATVRI